MAAAIRQLACLTPRCQVSRISSRGTNDVWNSLQSQRRSFFTSTPTTRQRQRKQRHGQTLSGTITYTVSPLPSGPPSASSGAGGFDSNKGTHAFKHRSAEALAALPPLRCPGGPRIKAEGIKHLYKVPHAGFLAKYGHRFVLNLKLTHQIASHLSRTTLKTSDKVLLELGPGAGSLTRSLLTRPCVGVLGVECDERFNAHLEQIRGYTKGKFQWVNADVLEMNELELLTRYYPAFVRQNQRRRPGADEGSGQASGDAADWESDDPSRATQDAQDLGYEGAPLRSRQRERLLRQRQARFGGPSVNPGPASARERFQRPHTSFHKHGYSAASGEGGSGQPHRPPSSRAALDVTDHWWADGDAKVEVVANLPFSVITELLMRYAVECSRRTGLFSFGRVPLHIFVQKEVADRIVAAPGSIHFSRLSVLTQAFFHVKVLQVFTEWTYYPKTEVQGTLLTLEPRVVPLGWSADGFSTSQQQQQQTAQRGSEQQHFSVDGAALIHFTDLVMKAGHRGSSIHKALSAFMPPEVVQYVLQASRMDGAMTVLDLTVDELVRMAGMWRAFLTASQQHSAPEKDGLFGERGDGYKA